MTKLFWIGLGGALGAVLRFGVSSLAQSASGGWFPLGTLTVNVLGSLVMGIVGGALSGPLVLSETGRLALTVGLLGGFTTFSAYAWEAVALAEQGLRGEALAYVFLSNACALGGLWIGWLLADHLLSS